MKDVCQCNSHQIGAAHCLEHGEDTTEGIQEGSDEGE